MTSEQARILLEYLERQESILNHDNEAYRLHSGASFVLRTLGITREQVEEQAYADKFGLFIKSRRQDPSQQPTNPRREAD